MPLPLIPKHSALPWHLIENSSGGATLVRGGGDWKAHPQSHLQVVPHEDAEFIVRAANNFYSLLNACQMAMHAFEKNAAINWDDIRRAIEKAEQ